MGKLGDPQGTPLEKEHGLGEASMLELSNAKLLFAELGDKLGNSEMRIWTA